MDRDEWFHDDGTLTIDFMNRVIALILSNSTVERFIEIHEITDPGEVAEVRGFWDRTVQWMEDHPLKPGQSYDTLA